MNTPAAYGLPTYEILVAGKKIPQTHGQSVLVLGGDKFYHNNVLYKSELDGGKFSTSSEEALKQFLELVHFAKLEYPDKILVALQAAEKASKRYKA